MAAPVLRIDDDGVMAEINMTPLVDVMLVLLIIFMITMPVITRQLSVQLPETQSGDTAQQQDILMVQVTADGVVMLDNQALTLETLRSALVAAAAAKPDIKVHLAADRQVYYGEVMSVMDIIRDAGIHSLGFVTRPAG
ncbi:MAG: biopolymer transporter ExbD [Ketobacteraceae bacterium]|nr:biopolymer transporter ExbD [Ketobacteraceae bacterium]